MGAFFAIYWLARLDIDGAKGFTFGVDPKTWQPREQADEDREDNSYKLRTRQALAAQAIASESPHDPHAIFFAQTPAERMQTFYKAADWTRLAELMVSAGLLRHNSAASGTREEFTVDAERMAGMLALTAFHDIMKVHTLLPTVQRQHAPYHGFGQGSIINDHDLALGYILEHYGSSLPSYAMLPEALQRTIRFSTVKMGFNHGWLVQVRFAIQPTYTCMALTQALTYTD